MAYHSVQPRSKRTWGSNATWVPRAHAQLPRRSFHLNSLKRRLWGEHVYQTNTNIITHYSNLLYIANFLTDPSTLEWPTLVRHSLQFVAVCPLRIFSKEEERLNVKCSKTEQERPLNSGCSHIRADKNEEAPLFSSFQRAMCEIARILFWYFCEDVDGHPLSSTRSKLLCEVHATFARLMT